MKHHAQLHLIPHFGISVVALWTVHVLPLSLVLLKPKLK
jgi:hypothetical protein